MNFVSLCHPFSGANNVSFWGGQNSRSEVFVGFSATSSAMRFERMLKEVTFEFFEAVEKK